MTDLGCVPVLPAKRMAAGVVFEDEGGRVLLVEPTYKEGWEFPGGVVEADESPMQAACREVREELGLDLAGPLPLMCVDWVPARGGRGDAVVMLFDGGRVPAATADRIRLADGELASYQFVSPADVAAFLPPIRVRRLVAALAARPAVVYLEDGRPVSGEGGESVVQDPPGVLGAGTGRKEAGEFVRA